MKVVLYLIWETALVVYGHIENGFGNDIGVAGVRTLEDGVVIPQVLAPTLAAHFVVARDIATPENPNDTRRPRDTSTTTTTGDDGGRLCLLND